MADPQPNATALDTSDPLALGAMLAPVVKQAAGDNLGDIEWFRTSWQRGGAATGFSTWTLEDGSVVPCMVKVPVGPVERRWAAALGDCWKQGWTAPDCVALSTPRVLASADHLGAYDLCWLVVERFEGGTVATHFDEHGLRALIDAACDFQIRAERRFQPTGRPIEPDWAHAHDQARQMAHENTIPDAQHWNNALKHARKLLPEAMAMWRARPVNAWLHGDLHPANAMWRQPSNNVHGHNGQRCALIDLGMVHPGHWAEDGLYLERQFWGRTERLCGLKPVSMIARARREAGLPVEDEYARLLQSKRLIASAAAPANLEHEGDAIYLSGALAVLERSVRALGG
ncbi:MAG: aminoglycoside phosphotransferase family protein [Phycisphaerales bacterium]